mmetsp:Transcript_13594/g.42544  ORF Transcript_13594/g.42544 Transcript_13594/m.42544 type:complete len:321 (+) Transcript_13594:292-1254(+)
MARRSGWMRRTRASAARRSSLRRSSRGRGLRCARTSSSTACQPPCCPCACGLSRRVQAARSSSARRPNDETASGRARLCCVKRTRAARSRDDAGGSRSDGHAALEVPHVAARPLPLGDDRADRVHLAVGERKAKRARVLRDVLRVAHADDQRADGGRALQRVALRDICDRRARVRPRDVRHRVQQLLHEAPRAEARGGSRVHGERRAARAHRLRAWRWRAYESVGEEASADRAKREQADALLRAVFGHAGLERARVECGQLHLLRDDRHACLDNLPDARQVKVGQTDVLDQALVLERAEHLRDLHVPLHAVVGPKELDER